MAQRSHNPFIYLSGLIAAGWAFAAWVRPGSNFILFPILIAAMLPLSYRLNRSRALSSGAALGAATAGFINVAVVAVLLGISGKLDGPPLVDGVGPIIEAMALGLLGGAAGAGLSMLGNR
jgi:hypothetical protein